MTFYKYIYVSGDFTFQIYLHMWKLVAYSEFQLSAFWEKWRLLEDEIPGYVSLHFSKIKAHDISISFGLHLVKPPNDPYSEFFGNLSFFNFF